LPEGVRVLHLDLLHRCERNRLEVTSPTELDRWIDDIVHADLFLRRQSAELIASTRQVKGSPVDPALQHKVIESRTRRKVRRPDASINAPAHGCVLPLTSMAGRRCAVRGAGGHAAVNA
jgi:hypothetical protein